MPNPLYPAKPPPNHCGGCGHSKHLGPCPDYLFNHDRTTSTWCPCRGEALASEVKRRERVAK